jgi:hypothetical protein
MNRIITLLGIILAVLYVVLILAGLSSTFVQLMLPASVVLVGVGVITGN